jgi:hypothetical protein
LGQEWDFYEFHKFLDLFLYEFLILFLCF